MSESRIDSYLQQERTEQIIDVDRILELSTKVSELSDVLGDISERLDLHTEDSYFRAHQDECDLALLRRWETFIERLRQEISLMASQGYPL